MTQAIHFSRNGEARIGRLEGETITDAGPAGPSGFIPDEKAWDQVARANGETSTIAEVRVLAPVTPTKILAIALNYQSHIEETSLAKPDTPVMFAKFPSSITGPYDDIVIPREETRPDYEGEIGVVISKRGYRVGVDEAWDYVGGLTVLNDVSGRRAQLETPMRQFTLGKSFDTFTPIGPVIASLDSLDLSSLGLETRIGGVVMQSGDSSQFIFDIPTLIEYLSRGLTLEPGDIIATGTPGGVGDERKPPRYLKPGDVVEVEVDGIGVLRNPVRAEGEETR